MRNHGTSIEIEALVTTQHPTNFSGAILLAFCEHALMCCNSRCLLSTIPTLKLLAFTYRCFLPQSRSEFVLAPIVAETNRSS